ncbi:hypothetical protein TsFJ059_006914 [Trichoderma semiorbis]|uniref:O-methyltransferase C-terminal domain-containing protein n=1 Tax=Trichoderma semiorbis TaxID=1491008 RepID=A0A9P8KRY6_9HYPO|nr:hypothetical protein TsFJ059_006914 [Trichoderma semiorbis]
MSSLVALAEEVLAQAKEVEQLLEQNNLPPTSFDKDTLELLPDSAQKLRWDLLDTSHTITQLLRGARLSGLDIAFGWTDQLILRIIWRYRLASAVPLDGTATYDEISATSGLGRSLVTRTIRSAMTLNIFDEPEPGHICHTAISRLLAADDGYYSAIGLQLEDIGPASLKLIEAWQKFGDDAGEPDQSAFSLQNGGRSLFKVLAEEPERANRFDGAMKYCVEDKDFNFFDIINGFDWSTLDRPGARLVDLGGGYGQISQALAKKTQNLSFTIHDLPHVVEKGRKLLPAEFSERISFQEQNFMEPQQSENPPDAYLISRCLHNWSDHHSAIILRALIPALQKGSKILIWDSVLEDRPVKKLSGKFNFQQDFIMATISNGKDRSAEEFRRVLELSDPRFTMEGVRRPEGCKLAMVEVTWNP